MLGDVGSHRLEEREGARRADLQLNFGEQEVGAGEVGVAGGRLREGDGFEGVRQCGDRLAAGEVAR